MSEYKPVRMRRGTLIHATDVESYRITMCGRSADGSILLADEVPTCRKCLHAILQAIDCN